MISDAFRNAARYATVERGKRKARSLMLPMIRWHERNSCGWNLARHIRPDLAADYDRGVEIAKNLMADQQEALRDE